MPNQVTPVYTSYRSDIFSQVSPIFKGVCLMVLVVAVCMGACNSFAQEHQPQPMAAKTAGNAAGQSSESTSETLPSDRQLQIAEQSAGLLQMAKDLKAVLDTTTSDTLSAAAFRKADAIERFTQLVKDQNKHPNRKP